MDEMTRSAFEALSPSARVAFIQGGGQVKDDPPPARLPDPLPPGTLRREAFNALPALEQGQHIRSGGQVVD